MKQTSAPVQRLGNVDMSKAKALTISSKSIGKLMGLFSNQYGDKNLAVLREYFCNGDDARIAAGSTRPTEVWLPTDLQPSLTIRDFGIGLDRDGLEETYSTYGESTKDQDDDATGHFGIGSKAGFTLVEQFTVTGYKDGQMTTALFSLDDTGVSQIAILHEGPTQEPNGVLVSMAIPDAETMRQTAERFFSTVPQGRVLVDGEEPSNHFETHTTTEVSDEATLVDDEWGGVYVRMGPVVYPVNPHIRRLILKRLTGTDHEDTAASILNWSSSSSLYFEIEMGGVTLAPSREDLRDTDTTINRLTAAVVGISQRLVGGIQAKIDAAPSFFAAHEVLRNEMALLKSFSVPRKVFTYGKGKKAQGFKAEVEIPLPVFHTASKSWGSSVRVLQRAEKFHVTSTRVPNVLVVAGVPKEETSKVSRYAKRFIEENEDGIDWVIVSPENSGAFEWFEYGTEHGARTMTLPEYRAALRDLHSRSPRRVNEPSYSTGFVTAARDVDDRDLLSDILSEGRPLAYALGSASHYRRNPVAVAAVEDYELLVLTGQQSPKAMIKRVVDAGHPEPVPVSQVITEAAEKILSTLTDEEREALAALDWLKDHRFDREALDLLKSLGDRAEDVLHPFFQETEDLFELVMMYSEQIPETRMDTIKAARSASTTTVELPSIADAPTPLTSIFPLLEGVPSHRIRRNPSLADEIIKYINSKI